MVHANGTMDVMIGDKIEQRKYTMVVEEARQRVFVGKPAQYEPKLKEGEQAIYHVGNDVPVIIQVHWPDPHGLQALCKEVES